MTKDERATIRLKLEDGTVLAEGFCAPVQPPATLDEAERWLVSTAFEQFARLNFARGARVG